MILFLYWIEMKLFFKTSHEHFQFSYLNQCHGLVQVGIPLMGIDTRIILLQVLQQSLLHHHTWEFFKNPVGIPFFLRIWQVSFCHTDRHVIEIESLFHSCSLYRSIKIKSWSFSEFWKSRENVVWYSVLGFSVTQQSDNGVDACSFKRKKFKCQRKKISEKSPRSSCIESETEAIRFVQEGSQGGRISIQASWTENKRLGNSYQKVRI